MARYRTISLLARGRPSSSMVVACISLVISLSGATYAAIVLPRNSVGTKHLKTNAVVSSKVKNGTLKPADVAGGRIPPRGKAGGNLAGKYPNPKIANGAVTQPKLAPAEDWHEVGTPGEPPFSSPTNFGCDGTPLWQNNASFDHTAAFYRDPYGVVHLKGVVKGGDIGCAIFVLPPGYQPGEGYAGYSETHAVISNGAIGNLWIIGSAPDSAQGSVIARSGSNVWFSLDGVTFRCGPRGVDGCP